MKDRADRNLLYGILAVQLDFIGRDALIAAMHAWVLDKSRPLGVILVDQKALKPDRHALLSALVEEHLKAHDGDPEKSLASLVPGQSTRDRLEAIGDPEVAASLAPLRHPDASFIPTAAPNPGDFKADKRRFRQLRPHAKGGLGIVYVAHDSELTREVALKEIQERHADNPDSRARFVREAEITGALEHPGIVPVYGLGTYGDGRPYYAMRFIRGDSLKEVIADFHKADALPDRDPGERAVALRKLLGRFIDVCDAMDYAHNRGVLHRDLKPGNIMVGKYGETLVVDWGLAKTVGGEEPTDPTAEPRISSTSGSSDTVAGSTIGTPQYMSPEQAAGRLDLLGPASDVYSLGATLFTLLTGKPPVESEDVGEILRRVQKGEIPAPRSVKPQAPRLLKTWSFKPESRYDDVPKPLEAICQKAMALSPTNRYPTPRALAEDIEHWLADEPVSALPETRSQSLARWGRRHRAWVQSGVAALVLISVVAVSAVVVVDSFRQSEATEKKAAIKSDDRTKEALRLVEEQKREVESQIAQIHFNKGLDLCERGESAQGLLWLARGLERVPIENGELARRIRMQITAWGHEPHRLRAIFSHQNDVRTASFSPDGKTVVTASGDKTARLWDTATGRQIGPTLDHQGRVNAPSFSPNGKKVVTASYDKMARLWDAATGRQIGPPLAHEGTVWAASFSPDGKTVVTASGDETARLWDVATGRQIGPPLAHQGGVNTASFSPDGKTVVTASNDKSARLWDVATGSPIGPPLVHQGGVTTASFSPDGKALVTANFDKTARLWDVATGRQIGPPLAHQGGVTTASFSSDGKTVVTASYNKTARLWDAATGRPIGPPLAHEGTVWAASFSPDGKTVVTASDDKTARLWDAATGRQIGPPLAHENTVWTASFSPDGKTVVTASGDKTARLWDTATGRQIGPPLAHQNDVRTASFSPDGKTLVTASLDKTVHLWDTATGRQIGPPLAHQNDVRTASFSPDGKTLVTASYDKAARLWDTATGRQIGPPLAHESTIRTASFSPDGKTVVTASYDETARLWDTATGRPIGPPLVHEGTVWAASFSPDGKTLVTASGDKTARLWDVAIGRQIGPPLAHQGGVTTASFSPDGKTVVTASLDKTARLWDIATGSPIGLTLAHQDSVWAASFSPDGKTVVTASLDKTARLWDIATGSPISPPLAHQDLGWAVSFSPDGKTVVTASKHNTAQLWDAATGRQIGPPLAHQALVFAASFSPDGKTVVTASFDNTARLWDTATGRQIGPPLAHQDGVTTASFSPDGKTVVTASNDKTARLWVKPPALPGQPKAVTAWCQRITGLTIDETEVVRALSADEWNVLPKGDIAELSE